MKHRNFDTKRIRIAVLSFSINIEPHQIFYGAAGKIVCPFSIPAVSDLLAAGISLPSAVRGAVDIGAGEGV